MKKFIAVVITVIMLMSVCGMQSFAFTIKLPTVTEVSVVDASPVSMKELDRQKAERDELIERYMEEFGVTQEELDEYLQELMGSNVGKLFNRFHITNAVLELTLSDGSVVECDLEDGVYDIDDYTWISVNAYVTYDEYTAAKEEDRDTVEVIVECSVTSIISGISKDSEFTLESEVVDCFIKDFTPVSALDYSLYEYSDTLDLEGKKFRVTYADGSKKTLTAKYDSTLESYVLGDEEIWVWFDSDDEDNFTVELHYMDEIYEHSVTFDEASPYESIEITDYVFSETDGLTSISYVITDTKGNEKSFTVDTTAGLYNGSLYPEWHNAAVYDSYYIAVLGDVAYGYDEEEAVNYEVYISMGDLESESIFLDYYEDEPMTFLEKIEEIIASILAVFFNILSFFDTESVI